MNNKIKKALEPVIKRLERPFFFYDLNQLQMHLTKMNEILHPDIKLWYACKANPMSAILKVLRNLSFGIDVASRGELLQVLNTGISGENILSTGPCKTRPYLRHFLQSGVTIFVLESINQAIWLNEEAKRLGIRPQVLLRLQLDWSQGESVLGGNDITPFGISPKEWLELPLEKVTQLNFKGCHVFQWGNILNLEQLVNIWQHSIDQSKALFKNLHFDLEIMDLGGGLGIPYVENQKPIQFESVHEKLVQLKKQNSLSTIWLELGRFTVGECGYYFTRIADIKMARGKKVVVCESGINHLARVALTKESFPCYPFHNSQSSLEETIVCGPLCTALDRLGTFKLPTDLQIGDWLYFEKTGAYGFTESMPYFLCHGLPGEVTLYRNDMMIPRTPKDSFEWLI